MRTTNNTKGKDLSITITDAGFVGMNAIRISKGLDGYDFDEVHEVMEGLDSVLSTEDIDTIVEYANDNLFCVEYL